MKIEEWVIIPRMGKLHVDLFFTSLGLGDCVCEKGLEIVIDRKLNVSKKCGMAAKSRNKILDCMNRTIFP